MWHSEDLAERGVIQRSGCLAGGSRIVQTPVGCGKLQDIIDTERLTCTERILRPDAGMVIHHTLIERSHAGWLEEDSWNKLELGPRGAIIAKRSGYCTTIAYVPSPTQFFDSAVRTRVIQWRISTASPRNGLRYNYMCALWRSMGKTHMSRTAEGYSRLAQVKRAQ